MNTKKLGRPTKENKLTSAQKQSNYRLRCAARIEDMGKSVSFEYDVFNEIKNAIAQVIRLELVARYRLNEKQLYMLLKN